MKQFVYSVEKEAELDSSIASFKKECPASCSAVLVTIFTHFDNPDIIERIIGKLTAALPEAQIAGMTTSGGINDGHLEMHRTIVNFMVFDDTRIKIFSFGEDIDPIETGDWFLEECLALKNLQGIEFLATLHTFNAQGFMKRLDNLPESVTVFGGGADNYDADHNTYVFTKDTILNAGMVAVCFDGASLKLNVHSGFGWKPLGSPMKITATHGNMIIRELDEQPAISVYEKYLNITGNQYFRKNTLEFPLLLERDGANLARLPDDYTDDGALVFNADCHEGEYVRLAYGDAEEILRHTRHIQQAIIRTAPEGILVFSCVTRRIFLGDAVDLELKHYHDIAPTGGGYTHGEFDRRGGRIQMLNMTLVTAGFREGNNDAPPASLPDADAGEIRDAMSLAQRLACFITVTSRELVQANRKLSVLAKHDRLTDLYNRGEIEANLKRQLDANVSPLSVVMLDIDNFKSINDTFGHEMGDSVLKTVAQILTQNIRQVDAAGRWGGEEFLIVLPGSNLDAAVTVAERIRKKLEMAEILPDKRNVTASFGAAEILDGEEYLTFYQRVDSNLYTAKHTGKNRVVAN